MSHRSNRTVALTTLGCKVNQADSDEWVRGFGARGYEVVDFDQTADAYVVNTCTVTHVADRKSRQLLRQARRQNPAALIVATGCYAAVAPDDLARQVEIDLIVGDADKPRLVDLVHERLEGDAERPHEVFADEPGAYARHRGLVKIGDGCDKFCAFCIVPYARGRARSAAADEVIGRVRRLVETGFREVVLTAVHMGTYGRDLTPATTLRALVRRVLDETGVERLRLSSIEPEDFDPEILDLWSDPRLCRHFHLALDSGCDATLRRMRRRYTADQYRALVERIRSALPGAAITTDVMVGFPGETSGEFETSRQFVEAMGFAGIHVFPYSSRRRTTASKLPAHVDPPEKRRRTEIMLGVASASATAFRMVLVGQSLPVLYEDRRTRPDGELVWEGLTDNYVRVRVVSSAPLANQLLRTRIARVTGDLVEGELAEPASASPQASRSRFLRAIPLTAVSR
jgi:threonylcarbamoyladenosine tRNA methylthiotransferase MtaB